MLAGLLAIPFTSSAAPAFFAVVERVPVLAWNGATSAGESHELLVVLDEAGEEPEVHDGAVACQRVSDGLADRGGVLLAGRDEDRRARCIKEPAPCGEGARPYGTCTRVCVRLSERSCTVAP